jgi:hypothetical protein
MNRTHLVKGKFLKINSARKIENETRMIESGEDSTIDILGTSKKPC